MRRYKYLQKGEISEAWNKLGDALLAAKDGKEVDEIMNALFTDEEKFQLGRRILIAECVKQNMTVVEICTLLRAGNDTVSRVLRKFEKYPRGFELIEKRNKKVLDEYDRKKYKSVGGSTLVFKKKEYTGIVKKDISR